MQQSAKEYNRSRLHKALLKDPLAEEIAEN